MRVRLHPTVEQAVRDDLAGRTVVVVDVLRATSCIIAGLESGAREIIPVEDVETASRLVRPSNKGVKVLAGERKGQPVEGFDLFNSPGEFTPETVGEKTVILTTSNGTRGILAASKAARVLVCAIVNIGAVAEALDDEKDVVILCCGNEGEPAVEDLLCGGLLMQRLGLTIGVGGLGDSALLALMLARDYGERIEDLLRSSVRGRQLVEGGYENDILYCSDLDDSRMAPELAQGIIRRRRDF